MKLTLYHGTSTKPQNPSCLYFTPDIEVAKQYAIALDDCGNYNDEWWIFSTEIDTEDVVIEEDFDTFDSLAYNKKDLDDVIYCPEPNWYIVKNPVLKEEMHVADFSL